MKKETLRFYLDEDNESYGYVSIVTSSMRDPCPAKLYRNIAKFVAKNVPTDKYRFVYAGPYCFSIETLKGENP